MKKGTMSTEGTRDLFGNGGLSDWHYSDLYARAEIVLSVPKRGTVLPTAEIRISEGFSGNWFWDACWNTSDAGGGCPFHGSESETRHTAIHNGIAWVEKKIPYMTAKEAALTRSALKDIR